MEGRNTDEVTDDSATRAIRLPRGPLSPPDEPPDAEDGDGSETIQVLRVPARSDRDDAGPAAADDASSDEGDAADIDADRTLPARPLPVRTVPAGDGAGSRADDHDADDTTQEAAGTDTAESGDAVDGAEASPSEDVTATQVWALADVRRLLDKAAKTTPDTTPPSASGSTTATTADADTSDSTAGSASGSGADTTASAEPDTAADVAVPGGVAEVAAPEGVAEAEDDATYTRPIPKITLRKEEPAPEAAGAEPAVPDELPSALRETPTLSVVIVTGEVAAWHNLRVTLASMRAQQAPPEQIIVVVDHCPELAELARSALDGVVVLHNEGHRGVAAARNLGLSAATGDVVAFHDDETAAEPDWSACLLEAFADRHVLAVRSNLTLRWVSGRPTWFPEELTWLMGDSCTGSPEEGEPLSDLYGAGLAFRREALEAAGGFPEDLDHQAGNVLAGRPAASRPSCGTGCATGIRTARSSTSRRPTSAPASPPGAPPVATCWPAASPRASRWPPCRSATGAAGS